MNEMTLTVNGTERETPVEDGRREALARNRRRCPDYRNDVPVLGTTPERLPRQ